MKFQRSSGNHYVDLFADEDGWIWIGVHFGSRGLGHKTATEFIRLGGGKDGIDVEPTLLRQDSELGQKYIAGMTLAGAYAYAGREWVIERVRRIVGGAVTDTVHNHHNYAWREAPGAKRMAVGSCGLFARVLPRPSWGNAASSAVRWATTP